MSSKKIYAWSIFNDINRLLYAQYGELFTRATYGGTESRFTDGSVVVLVVFFFFQVELLQLVARARNIFRKYFFVNLVWSP